jgi:hypothetical protein
MQWISAIPPTALVLLIAPLALAIAARAEHVLVKRGVDGWFTLSPSLVILILALLCVPMASFALLLLLAGSFDKFASGSLMAAVSVGGLYLALGMGARFNDDGVEYRGVFKTVFARWSEIVRVKYHPILGPWFMTKHGSFPAPQFFRGFRQLMDEAIRQGIEVPKAFQREAS